MEQKKESTAARYEELAALAASYVPEWKFTPAAPDPGAALAMLVDDMRADSLDRFSRVLHKHRIQYLNLFDRLVQEPVAAAQSYLCFTPVSGAAEPVPVPAGTRLLADDPESGRTMAFETVYGITATTAEVTGVVAAEGASDRISWLMGRSGAQGERQPFGAFDLSGTNCARHRLLLGFGRVLDFFSAPQLGLRVTTLDPEALPEALQLLCGPGLRYSLQLPGEERDAFVFPTPHADQNGVLWLDCAGLKPETVEFAGEQRYLLCLEADGPRALALSGLRLVLAENDLVPDAVLCGDVEQDPAKFFPFGDPLELYAECGIESRVLCARPGARVKMEFTLTFETREQLLPQVEENIDYKVIMRPKPEAPRLQTADVWPDYALLEYCSVDGWKRLVAAEHAAQLFNGSAQGSVCVEFVCPEDLVDDPRDAGGARLRLRLLRADGLYRLPCRVHCPVIENLRFSYRYDDAALLPDAALLQNDFVENDPLPLWRRERSLTLFESQEYGPACMYFQFDGNPEGSPLSLYFDLENNADQPLQFTAQYGGPNGFAALQTQDDTEGLLFSGTLRMIVPNDCRRQTLFGQEGYWLRLVAAGELPAPALLPRIRALRVNMVRAQNRRTRSELFYVDDPDAALEITAAEGNLVRMDVFVHEAGGDQSARWVRWKRRESAAETGRVCAVDLAAGRVNFAKGAFSAYPLAEEGAAVRLDYQSYQGSQANLPADTITTMEQPIRYIAHVTNPQPACGGYDGYSEETAAAVTSHLLRTRGRAVTAQDYADLIAQTVCGVRQIKCCAGVDRHGCPAPDCVSVALLIEQYDRGAQQFSAVRDAAQKRLLEAGALVPLGKTLELCQPRFLPVSVRLWLACGSMEDVYALKSAVHARITRFLDPLVGGFDGGGWRIGELPTAKQLLACLKADFPALQVERMVMVAKLGAEEVTADETLPERVGNPFAMAVSGSHTVLVRLSGNT